MFSVATRVPRNVCINLCLGALTVKDCLSETASVRIRAADQGSKPNIAEQNLTVVVTPNKNFWKFFSNKHYHFEVMKDIPIGTVVYDFSFKSKLCRIAYSIFSKIIIRHPILSSSFFGRPLKCSLFFTLLFDWEIKRACLKKRIVSKVRPL